MRLIDRCSRLSRAAPGALSLLALALLGTSCAGTAGLTASDADSTPPKPALGAALVDATPTRGGASVVESMSPGGGTSSAPSLLSSTALANAALGLSLNPFPEENAAGGGAAKPATADATELAKKTQNPVASMISVPIENVWNMNAGEHRRSQFISNIKPVIPQSLNEDWNWIHRVIVPLIDQPELVEGSYSRFGLGDVTYQGFLSPAKPEGLIWGVGPAITMPTATDDVLGSDKWSAGPALLGLKMDGPWVYGMLITNQWQIASQDSDRPRVGVGSIQPFVNYNLADGWYLSSAPTMVANWKADRAGDTWTVPLGVGVGKVFKIGDQSINVSLRPYYNVHHADNGSNWSLSFQVQFLFP